MSGFVGSPPPPRGIWAETQAEAWQIYRKAPGEYGYPIPAGGRWLVPRTVRLTNRQLAAEAVAVAMRYSPMFTPSPGSSKERARLKPEDMRRISQQIARRKRAKTGREEPDETMRQAAFF